MTIAQGGALLGDHPDATTGGGQRGSRELAPTSLVDLLDRLLGTGVVLAGDVIVSLAGVDLVEIKLHLLITSVRAEMDRP
ncbi:hypothetical protein GCM10009798_14850 [Nocardioides panacihumi]|uniref:Gas vesicle protein n=1 Tax=Nocardioides panacihumi TaxID=400774 RepID=A0ABN2QQF2_9ACTN